MVKRGGAIRSIVLIGKERFKSNLRQYIQIIGALLMATFCISLALQLFVVLEKPFDVTFERLKASHLLLLFEDDKALGNEISEWFGQQDEIAHVGPLQPYHTQSKSMLFEGRELDMDIQITERIVDGTLYDRLKIIKGKPGSHPNIGEIWLPYHFEAMHGIQLGDTLGIPSQGSFYEVEVSGFVVDPHYLSNVFNPTRAWVAPGGLSFFLPIQDLKNTTLGIRFKNPEALDAVWKRFGQEFDYSGIDLRHTVFKTAYSGFSKILSMVLLVFGIVLLVISMLIIKTTISSSILSDFKQIGVLKSIGYTRNNIIASYTLQSLVWLLIAIPLGLLLSDIAMGSIMNATLQKIGISELAIGTTSPIFITVLLMTGLVLVVCYWISRKAGKAKPTQALRNVKKPNATYHHGFGISLEGDFPLSPWFALRFIRNTLPNSISLILGFLGTFTLILFSINLYNSFGSLEKNKTAWGFDESDLVLTRQSSIVLPLNHGELMDILKNQRKGSIERIIPFGSLTAQIINQDGQKQQVFGKVYSDDLSKAGLINSKGEHPTKENEVALCMGTAMYHNKQIGDSVLLEVEGFKKTFRVTSIYQDISAFGQGFRLHQSAMLPLNPLYEPTSYGLVLEDQVKTDSIKESLWAHLGETVTIEGSIESRKSIVGLLRNMKLGILSISILFTLILLVIIGNDITLQIKQHDLIYAQMKSIGFHSNQLRGIILIRVMLLFAIGLVIAIPLGFMLGKPFAQVLASGLGIRDFPFYIAPLSIALVYLLLFLFVLVLCWFTSKLIVKINPRKLVEI